MRFDCGGGGTAVAMGVLFLLARNIGEVAKACPGAVGEVARIGAGFWGAAATEGRENDGVDADFAITEELALGGTGG